jgi:two-component system cell cycle response regulator DivK
MRRILLVEDNELNREMLSRRLNRLGYDVIVAVDGAAGVQQAVDMLPDLVLMDMSLPVLDGWEATRQLKAEEKTATIPVIGLSAHAMAGDAEKARKAGCDDYDTKPIDFERLAGKISKLVRNGVAR